MGGGAALDAVDGDPVGPPLLQLDGGEVCDAVGRDIRAWISHLVEQLLGYRCHRHSTTGVPMLGDDEVPFRPDLHDGITRVLQPTNRAPVLEAVSSRTLCSTLDHVACDRTRGHALPVGLFPTELLDDLPQRGPGLPRPTWHYGARSPPPRSRN